MARPRHALGIAALLVSTGLAWVGWHSVRQEEVAVHSHPDTLPMLFLLILASSRCMSMHNRKRLDCSGVTYPSSIASTHICTHTCVPMHTHKHIIAQTHAQTHTLRQKYTDRQTDRHTQNLSCSLSPTHTFSLSFFLSLLHTHTHSWCVRTTALR